MESQKNLRREDFGPLLEKAVFSIDLQKSISNGFRKCGLHLFSSSALNELLKKKKDKAPAQTSIKKMKLQFICNSSKTILMPICCKISKNPTKQEPGLAESKILDFFLLAKSVYTVK